MASTAGGDFLKLAKVEHLKNLLQSKGLPARGHKSDLISRIWSSVNYVNTSKSVKKVEASLHGSVSEQSGGDVKAESEENKTHNEKIIYQDISKPNTEQVKLKMSQREIELEILKIGPRNQTFIEDARNETNIERL